MVGGWIVKARRTPCASRRPDSGGTHRKSEGWDPQEKRQQGSSTQTASHISSTKLLRPHTKSWPPPSLWALLYSTAPLLHHAPALSGAHMQALRMSCSSMSTPIMLRTPNLRAAGGAATALRLLQSPHRSPPARLGIKPPCWAAAASWPDNRWAGKTRRAPPRPPRPSRPAPPTRRPHRVARASVTTPSLQPTSRQRRLANQRRSKSARRGSSPNAWPRRYP